VTELELSTPFFIEGLPVHPLTQEQLISRIVDWASKSIFRRICHLNVHALNLANGDSAFKGVLQSADLVYCDGVGVQIGARLLGGHIPQRLTLTDWIDEALSQFESADVSVFFLGDEPAVAAAAADQASHAHPRLSVAGWRGGFFETGSPEEDQIIAELHQTGPNVVFVGMGMPRQEYWVRNNARRLTPSVFISAGAAFKWYTGVLPRPNRLLRDHGLEWFGRLLLEPRRLWRRYLVGNPRFLIRVLRARLENSRTP